MARLLAKDLRTVGLFWLAGLVIDILFVMVFVEVNLAFLLVQVILTFLLGIVQPAVEDRFSVAPLINSLPVKRTEVVGAQYIGTGILIAGGLAVFVAVPSVFGAISRSPMIAAAPLMKPAGLLSFLLPLILLELLFLPLYFRHGLGKAIWLFLASLLGLAVILTIALRVLSGLVGQPLSRIFPVDRGILAMPFKPFLPLAGRMQAAVGALGLAVIALLIVTGLTWVSLCLSIRSYKRREF